MKNNARHQAEKIWMCCVRPDTLPCVNSNLITSQLHTTTLKLYFKGKCPIKV
jgi:hypothetical protein